MVSISVIEQTYQKIFCPLKDIVEQCCHLAPPDTTATTVFLCGNSTVVDQQKEPYASWGQMGKNTKNVYIETSVIVLRCKCTENRR